MKPLTKIARGPTGIQRQLSPLERAKAKFRPIVSLDKLVGLEREKKPSAPAVDMMKLLADAKAEVLAVTGIDKLKPSKYRDPEKRKAYMREFMRKKRAAE